MKKKQNKMMFFSFRTVSVRALVDWTDRQTDRQTERHGRTDRQTDRQTNRQIDILMDRQMFYIKFP